MIDELREEAIINKVGGRFKLSTLIQKRLVALNACSAHDASSIRSDRCHRTLKMKIGLTARRIPGLSLPYPEDPRNGGLEGVSMARMITS